MPNRDNKNPNARPPYAGEQDFFAVDKPDTWEPKDFEERKSPAQSQTKRKPEYDETIFMRPKDRPNKTEQIEDEPKDIPHERDKQDATPNSQLSSLNSQQPRHNSQFSRPQPGLELNLRKPVVHGRTNTLIPTRGAEIDPDDPFKVRGAAAFDDDDRPPRPAPKRRANPYEEHAEGGFFAAHARGLVALTLCALTIIIIAIWLSTSSAQIALGRFELAWSSAAYYSLGQEAQSANDSALAGRYYSIASKRSPNNRAYAVSAANAYISAGDAKNASEALLRCIELDPNDPEAYAALLYAYGGNPPAEIAPIIAQGYALTGDGRLR